MSASSSGQTAGRIHGLRQMSIGRIEVTVPHERTLDVARVGRRCVDELVLGGRPGPLDERTLPSRPASDALRAGGNVQPVSIRASSRGCVAPRARQSRAKRREYLELHRCRGKDGVSTNGDGGSSGRCPTSVRHRVGSSSICLRRDRAGRTSQHRMRQHPLTLIDGEVVHIDIAWPANQARSGARARCGGTAATSASDSIRRAMSRVARSDGRSSASTSELARRPGARVAARSTGCIATVPARLRLRINRCTTIVAAPTDSATNFRKWEGLEVVEDGRRRGCLRGCRTGGP